MQSMLGFDARDYKKGHKLTRVVWDSRATLNPHMLVLGTSGSGKTTMLRKIISDVVGSAHSEGHTSPRFHLFDVHGDLTVPGASSVRLSGQTEYGINPLVIDPDPHEGGIRKRVESVISAINKTSRKLGPRQEAKVRSLLYGLYERKGFFEDDPGTWTETGTTPKGKPKTFPTMNELSLYIDFLHRRISQLSDERGAFLLGRINDECARIYRKGKRAAADELTPNALAKLEESVEDLKRNFSIRLDKLMNGDLPEDLEKLHEEDSSGASLEAIRDQLSNFLASGIFKDHPPDFDPSCSVWRHDIKSLSDDEQRLFVQFRLEELFRRISARGMTDAVTDIIVVDEAHLFMDKDGNNMINRIAKEGRKFGVGLIAASQSPKHFSEDFLSLVAAKIILKTDESFWDYLNRKMRVPVSSLRWVSAGRRVITQIKSLDSKDSSGDYRLVLLSDGNEQSPSEQDDATKKTPSSS